MSRFGRFFREYLKRTDQKFKYYLKILKNKS